MSRGAPKDGRLGVIGLVGMLDPLLSGVAGRPRRWGKLAGVSLAVAALAACNGIVGNDGVVLGSSDAASPDGTTSDGSGGSSGSSGGSGSGSSGGTGSSSGGGSGSSGGTVSSSGSGSGSSGGTVSSSGSSSG